MKNFIISLGCLGIHDPSASTSYILGLQVWTNQHTQQ